VGPGEEACCDDAGEAPGRVDCDQLRGYPVDEEPHPPHQDGELQRLEDLRGAHTPGEASLQYSKVRRHDCDE
jgi:hypothetical protein